MNTYHLYFNQLMYLVNITHEEKITLHIIEI